MPRIDDYIQAKKIAAEQLSIQSFKDIVQRTGFESLEECKFRIPFLNRVYIVSFSDFEFQDEAEVKKQIPLQEQVLLLHYMLANPMPKISNKWIAYREIPGASFYFSAFVKRAIDPLKKVFGNTISGIEKAAEQLKGKPIQTGDVGFEFMILPFVPLQVILWKGDEEFPSEANILFDENMGKILSPEDVAWLAGMLVYRLIALSKPMG